MHDVVRDVALWIGGKEPSERRVVAVRDGTDLNELIKSKSFQNCRAISFMPDSLSELQNHDQLVCPELETMFIFHNRGAVKLTDAFFKHMQALKVLYVWRPQDFYWRDGFSLPQSVQCLADLQMLNLRWCDCYNIHVVGKLADLKILSLNGCHIDCGLEAVLMKMKSLILLDLAWCEFQGDELPSYVIKDMIKLEELYPAGAFSTEELSEMEGTRIDDGERSKDCWWLSERLGMINLHNVKGVEEIMHLQRGDENDQLSAFKLAVLVLENVEDLKCIGSGIKQNMSFFHLSTVHVMDCNNLKQLFTMAIVQKLELEDLPNLIVLHPATCRLALPSLTRDGFKLEGCPKMMINRARH